jgi:hypothetical protein
MLTTQLQPARPGREPLPQKYKALITVIFGIFMVILDTTVVNVAFPTLRAEFGAILATMLASGLSPQIAALQQKFLNSPPQTGVAPLAICQPTPVRPVAVSTIKFADASSRIPPQVAPLLNEACTVNIAGFEQAYRIMNMTNGGGSYY